jgi:hypothetical protein
MRITNISVASYSNGSFMVAIGDPETYVQINMTEEESDRVRTLVTDMFLSRQKSIAKEIETARPLMIELKPERVEEAPTSPPPFGSRP